MSKQAYVSLLSSDEYLNCILVLHQSLKKVNSQHELILVINDELNLDTLYELKIRNIKTIQFDKIQYPKSTIKKMEENGWMNSNLYNTADKLRIFSLTDYEKLVYLDADLLILKNIDYLFNSPNGCAVIDAGAVYDCDSSLFGLKESRDYYHNFNSGLLVIEPKENSFNELYKIMLDNQGYDQEIIRKYWSFWLEDTSKHLPQSLNVFVNLIPYYLGYGILNLLDIEILHFAGTKPFQLRNLNLSTPNGIFQKYYLELLNEARNNI